MFKMAASHGMVVQKDISGKATQVCVILHAIIKGYNCWSSSRDCRMTGILVSGVSTACCQLRFSLYMGAQRCWLQLYLFIHFWSVVLWSNPMPYASCLASQDVVVIHSAVWFLGVTAISLCQLTPWTYGASFIQCIFAMYFGIAFLDLCILGQCVWLPRPVIG